MTATITLVEKEVSRIRRAIDEIAFQTSIVALHAAISGPCEEDAAVAGQASRATVALIVQSTQSVPPVAGGRHVAANSSAPAISAGLAALHSALADASLVPVMAGAPSAGRHSY